MLKQLQTIFMCILFSGTLSSCYFNKRLVYLQNSEFSTKRPSLVENKRSLYRLQPFDIISVQIKSPVEQKEISGVFNASGGQNTMFANPGNLYLDGYSIDIDGKINLPVLG